MKIRRIALFVVAVAVFVGVGAPPASAAVEQCPNDPHGRTYQTFGPNGEISTQLVECNLPPM